LDVHSLLPAARRDAVALLKAKKLKTEKLKLNPVPSHFLSFQLAAFSFEPLNL
jgi:hypothetical protein